MQLVAALLPGSSLKSKPESRQCAREEDGSDGREQQQVITCKCNSAWKWEPQHQALNPAVSCAGCSCCSPQLPPDTREGVRPEGAFEILCSS